MWGRGAVTLAVALPLTHCRSGEQDSSSLYGRGMWGRGVVTLAVALLPTRGPLLLPHSLPFALPPRPSSSLYGRGMWGRGVVTLAVALLLTHCLSPPPNSHILPSP